MSKKIYKVSVFERHRRDRGQSQEQLARRLGVAGETISNFERGQSSPKCEDVIDWAREYGMTLEHFVEAVRNLRKDQETDE